MSLLLTSFSKFIHLDQHISYTFYTFKLHILKQVFFDKYYIYNAYLSKTGDINPEKLKKSHNCKIIKTHGNF